MFKRILIVLEPHREATAAIQAGAALAQVSESEVVLYSGLPRRPRPGADPPETETPTQQVGLQAAKAQAEALHHQAKGVLEGLGVMSRSVLTKGDDPVRSIVDAALAGRCELILVAKEGSNAVLRLLNGNVIPGLITASPVPVMVCAPAPAVPVSAPNLPTAPLRRILLVLEDGDRTQKALVQALELAQAHSAELLFVHVVPPDPAPVIEVSSFATAPHAPLAEEIRVLSQRLLATARAVARHAGLQARSMSLPSGTSHKDIARLAVDQGCDLVVVSHEGRNALMRLLTGSLIPGLVTAATVPLLVCREGEEAARKPVLRRRRPRHKAAAATYAIRDEVP